MSSGPLLTQVEFRRQVNTETYVRDTTPGTDGPPRYVLGHDEPELTRLGRQAALWESATRRALAAAGVPVGARCLDIGCGTGTVMGLIAEFTGATGRVVGADFNAELGRSTAARLNAAGPAIFDFQPIDVTRAENPGGGPYDLVFARLLLLHMTDPVAVLRRMWSWVAAGGTLLIQDYDLLPARAVPEREAVCDGFGFVRAACVATDRNPRIGTDVSGHFFAAGIGMPDGIDLQGQIVPARIGCSMLAEVMRSLAATIAEQRIVTAERFNAVKDEVSALAEESDLLMRMPDMIATWKRKGA